MKLIFTFIFGLTVNAVMGNTNTSIDNLSSPKGYCSISCECNLASKRNTYEEYDPKSTLSKKEKINALKTQLSKILNPNFVDGDYRESGFVKIRGTATRQIIFFQFSANHAENIDLTHEYKIDLSNVDKVEVGGIKGNTESACGIRIFLKKKGSYKFVQQKPFYSKENRNYHRIIIQTSSNRKDMMDAYRILSELVDLCK